MMGAGEGELVAVSVDDEVGLAEAEGVGLPVELVEGDGEGLSGAARTFHAVSSKSVRVNCG